MRRLGPLLLAVAATAARAQEPTPAKVVAADLPNAGGEGELKIDPATGDGWVGSLEPAAFVAVDGATGRRVRTIPWTGWRGSYAVEAGRLVVADLTTLEAFDCATGVRVFQLGLRATRVVPSPDPRPWVVVGLDEREGGGLAVVDVEKGAVLHTWPGREAPSALSDDGGLLLTEENQASVLVLPGPSGGEPLPLGWLRSGRRVPGGRSWACRDEVGLRPLDGALEPAGTGFPVTGSCVLLSRRALLVEAAEGPSLLVRDARTGRSIQRVKLAEARLPLAPDVLAVDGARDRVWCLVRGGGSPWQIVDLSDVPGEPYLLRPRPAAIVEVGQELTVDAAPLDGAVEVTLVEPPAGARLAGSRLTWRPTAEQVGRSTLRFTARRGEVRDEATTLVEVRWPSIATDLEWPNLLQLSPDGRWALVCGSDTPRGSWRARAVDLDRRVVGGTAVLAQTSEMQFALLPVTLGVDAAYTVDGKALRRLALPDLVETARVELAGLPDMAVLGSTLVTWQRGGGPSQITAFDAATLAPRWSLPGFPSSGSPGARSTPDGGLEVQGLSLGPSGQPRGLGGLLVDGRLAARDGLRALLDQADERDRVRLDLEARRPVLRVRDAEGRVAATLPAPGLDRASFVAWVGSRAVVGDRRLTVVPLPAPSSAAVVPLQVDLSEARPLLLRSDDDPLTLEVRAVGGKEPRRVERGVVGQRMYDTAPSGAGLTLDPARGALTLDPKAAWRASLDAPGRIVWTRATARRFVEGLTPLAGPPRGRPIEADGYPLLVELPVAAVDGEGRLVRRTFLAVVVGPWAEVEGAQPKAAPNPNEPPEWITQLRRELEALRATAVVERDRALASARGAAGGEEPLGSPSPVDLRADGAATAGALAAITSRVAARRGQEEEQGQRLLLLTAVGLGLALAALALAARP